MKAKERVIRPHSRLDVKSGFHRKVLHVGNAAWGAFQRLVAISNDYGTDGWVDSTTVSTVCSETELATLLASFPWAERNSPLLETSGTGYRIHDFLDWNDSAEFIRQCQINKAKAGKLGAKRTANWRAKQTSHSPSRDASHVALHDRHIDRTQGRHTGVGVGDVSESSEGESEGEDTKTAKLEAREAQYRKAYVAGVQRGKGAPFVFPSSPWTQGDLNALLKAAGGLRDEALLGWIENTAYRFARWLAAHPDKTDFYSSYLPKGCAKFINDQSRVPRTKTATMSPAVKQEPVAATPEEWEKSHRELKEFTATFGKVAIK